MLAKKILGTLLLSGTVSIQAIGTHLRAGEIEVKRTDCESLTFQITIIGYINYSTSSVHFGGENDRLSFGDGTSILVPEIETYEVVDAELGVGRVKFTIDHSYNSYGEFTISYNEANRNGGVINFDNSINTAFYVESSILIEPGICNSSPIILISPIDRACKGVAFFHNPGAIDPDQDSLSFELVIPKQNGLPVINYSFPNKEKFYVGIPYEMANEAQTGPPVFNINPTDGTIIWDAPGMIGEFTVAFKITEWKFRNSDSTWYRVGNVVRDMQIIVEECSNQKPQLQLTADLCVIAGTTIDFTVRATDPNGDPVIIEAFSDAFLFAENAASISSNGTLQSTQAPNDTAAVEFHWETTCEHVRDQYYRIIFKISDRPASGPRLIQFYTVNIKIIAPEPAYKTVSINPISKNVRLEWEEYSCDNVHTFQVWRRISVHNYTQPECNNGMPYFLRYQLLKDLPGNVFNYTDRDLAFGSQYCYRIVALVGNKKTPSRISLDTCFIPKPAEAPVITNVSVNQTDSLNGSITIRWTPPFDIDQQQYPPPFTYKIYRQNESAGNTQFDLVTTTAISDTTFLDVGLNTLENSYRYKIELYVPSLAQTPADTSSEASSVFLTSNSILNGIELTWKANTPWYNYSQDFPNHIIYRSDKPLGEFIAIDSVNVNENDFHYIDRGEYNNLGLSSDIYYYKIKTRGVYGNPGISSPLENFSQVTRGVILDTIPPCAPALTVTSIDCKEFSCEANGYFNILQWEITDPECSADVVAYELMVNDQINNQYVSLGIFSGNTFKHINLNSLDKCYKIVSIDRGGNRSDSSAVICNFNCTNFKFPNVITPGLKDDHNDFLTTYTAENGSTLDCMRSVLQVSLKIYSRSGDEIFTTALNPEANLVFWEGVNNAGVEVSSGIYFYWASVTFDTTDPSKKTRQIKGWIQVVR